MESKKENTRNIKKMESVLRLKKRITVSKHAITSNKMQSNLKKAISVHTNNEEDRRHKLKLNTKVAKFQTCANQ